MFEYIGKKKKLFLCFYVLRFFSWDVQIKMTKDTVRSKGVSEKESVVAFLLVWKTS